MEGPIRGYLFESEIRQNGETLDSVAYACLAIEGEMALRISENGQVEAAFPSLSCITLCFGPLARRWNWSRITA
jgi:hypothetical protein